MIFPRQRQNGLRSDRGFTLIEMIISIVMIAILGTFSVGFLKNLMLSTQLTAGQKDLVDEAKLAMEFMTRELRFANESVDTIQCEATAITLQDCVPGTSYDTAIAFDKLFGRTEDASACVVYTFDPVAGTLKRTSKGTFNTAGDPDCATGVTTTTTLATHVATFTIIPADKDGTVADAEFFQIIITLQGSEGENFSLESGVLVRSLI